ncbi:MAG: HDOD domain-containing protein [Deltaproteobacteria bacterium]|nr:HDOD domain-containing protein [Deltaproteobacteria bacterium]MBN2673094.1 HDOD domain-containing protein [Deltaproteobacteria bacterium]
MNYQLENDFQLTCAKCGSTNPTSAKFCNSCGTPMDSMLSNDTQTDPFIGKLVGHRFVVQKKIGEGGMGVVYRGIQTGIERPVALKLLHAEFAKDKTLLERFKNEAATASMLTHPNTVTIYDFGSTDDGSLYIAMEFLQGTELSQVIKSEGAMNWMRAGEIAIQICSSLEEAHNNKIIHRDLKPDNIMLSDRGERKDIVKVLDFGIAKIKNREDQKQLTAAGEIFGTPEYISPEQIKGESLTSSSDIYSLGVILYHMLTGTLPFVAPQPMALLVKHLADVPPPFSQANSTVHVPTELETLVMLSLAKTPKERPRSMAEIAGFLKQLIKTHKQQTIQIESSLSKVIADKSQRISVHAYHPASNEAHAHSLPSKNPAAEQRSMSARYPAVPQRSISDNYPAMDQRSRSAKYPAVQQRSMSARYPAVQQKSISANYPAMDQRSRSAKYPAVEAAPTSGAHQIVSAPSEKTINHRPDAAVDSSDQNATLVEKPHQKKFSADYLDTDFPSKNRSKDEILRELIKKMKRKRDFPAVSKHVSELNSKVSNDSISARQLSNVILKDYSLTNKLLKLINSPYYGQVRGKITTVSRAVVLMGFDQVRQAALGLLMFDHFCMQAGPEAQALSNSMLASLLSGLTARHIAGRVPGINIEEAFVCAMMRSLGKNLVAFYFPTKYQSILQTMRKKKLSEERASTEVLGVTFEELAQALAREWSLPDSILQSMAKLPDGPLDKPKDAGEKMRNVSAFSNELTYISTHGSLETRIDDMNALLHKYEETFQMSQEEVEQLYEDLSEKLEDYSEAMNLGFKNSPLIKRIMAWSGHQVSTVPDPLTIAPAGDHTVRPLISYTPEKLAREERVARERILLQGVDEVAAAVARHEDMNNIVSIVLETMYRGLKLSHVLFCLYDTKTDSIRARSGFGDEIDDLIRKFHFKHSRSGDLFTTSMAQGRDMFVDLNNKGYLSNIPAWYRDNIVPLPQQFIIYPVLVNSFAVGLFYGDVAEGQEKLSRAHLSHMMKLRANATKAIKRAMPKIRKR